MLNLKTIAISAVLAVSLVAVPVFEVHAKKSKSSSRSSYSFSTSKSYSKPSWGSSSRRSSKKQSQGWGGKKSAEVKKSVRSPSADTKKPAKNSQPKRQVQAQSRLAKDAVKPNARGQKQPSQSTSGWGGASVAEGKKQSGKANHSLLAAKPSKALATAKQQKAFTDYKKQRQKFQVVAKPLAMKTGPVGKSALYSRAAKSSHRNSRDYWDRRDRYYRDWDTPDYVYYGASRYGVLDGMFLGYMLDNAMMPDYAAFAYHHQNDPDMQAWMSEMEERAEDDPELRMKLGILKMQLARLNGTPIVSNYVPDGIQADMALAPDVAVSVKSDKPRFRYCTAGKEGNYYRHGQLLRVAAVNDIEVELINTSGTLDNLGRMERNECDGSLAQRTGFKAYAEQHPNGHFNFERMASPALEFAHMVCNRQSGVASVKDLEGKILLVGKAGSGSAQAWRDFVATDANYVNVMTSNIGGIGALNKVVIGAADCMLYVASLNTSLMKKANSFGDKLVLVPVNDSSFNQGEYDKSMRKLASLKDQSGEEMYTFKRIPGEQYPNIQDGFFSSSVETLSVPMDMVVSLEWSETHPDTYDSLINAILSAQVEFDQSIRAK